jgi:hypothetical protein
VGGTVSADPALSATAGGGRLVAVVRELTGAGWVNVADASGPSWSGWRRIGGVLASPPPWPSTAPRVAAYGRTGGFGRMSWNRIDRGRMVRLASAAWLTRRSGASAVRGPTVSDCLAWAGK